MRLWLLQRAWSSQRPPQPGKQLMSDSEMRNISSTYTHTIASYTGYVQPEPESHWHRVNAHINLLTSCIHGRKDPVLCLIYVLNVQKCNSITFSFVLSVEVVKEERPELQKKTYKWNTKEEAKQAFKELLKEKVIQSEETSKNLIETTCLSFVTDDELVFFYYYYYCDHTSPFSL